MAYLKIKQSFLKGALAIPPSKSHTMRALIFGAMGEGTTQIHHYLKSPDTFCMVQALGLLGVPITVEEHSITIQGVSGQLKPCADVIQAGNSGQVLRFIGSLAALLPTYTILTGDHSIRHQRPVQPLLFALTQLHAFAISSRLNGQAPIIIRGPMQPGVASLSGEDSQPVSGLLMATSFLEGTTYLKVTRPGEKPWIDLTLSWLERLGGNVINQNYENYIIRGPLHYRGFEMTIPGDFSAAAFPLCAALITDSRLTLENVDTDDVQGDKKILAILTEMGARFDIDKQHKTITVCPPTSLQGATIDANEVIDALPLLTVLGCFAEGKTVIYNAAIARKKESDRIQAIATELKKMGGNIEEKEDGLIVTPSCLKGAHVHAHADHRIAMALAIAALRAAGETSIEGVDCIQKSYPTFASDFQKIGAQFENG